MKYNEVLVVPDGETIGEEEEIVNCTIYVGFDCTVYAGRGCTIGY